jgi:hypothetical protein
MILKNNMLNKIPRLSAHTDRGERESNEATCDSSSYSYGSGLNHMWVGGIVMYLQRIIVVSQIDSRYGETHGMPIELHRSLIKI